MNDHLQPEQVGSLLHKLFTINEAAAVLRIKRTSMYSMLKSGQLEAVHIAGRTLVTAASIDALIANAPRYKSAASLLSCPAARITNGG